jgi:2-polyprenyl-6-methoxyphenol hydroxylase-like FAD-dependent oxidoreductase
MYDAIIVGARCAGAPTAMLLARKGYRVLLLDKARFPSDTLSVHYIHQPGVACLHRWGLLERVIASNCPPVRRQLVDFGPVVLEAAPPPIDSGRAPRCGSALWSTICLWTESGSSASAATPLAARR